MSRVTETLATDISAGIVLADAIFSLGSAPALWPSSRPALALVVEVLRTVEDDLARNLIGHLAVLLVDRDESLHVIREVLSATLAMTHAQHCEIVRLKGTLGRLRDEYRALRVNTLRRAENP